MKLNPVLLKKLPLRGQDPLDVYRALAPTPRRGALLESARITPGTGRYSIAAADPFLTLSCESGRASMDPFEAARPLLRRFKTPPQPIPFAGGAIGYFAYEAKRFIEPSSDRPGKPGEGLPEAYLMFFDEGVVIDHAERALWLFVHGGTLKRLKRLEERLRSGLKKLSERPVMRRGDARLPFIETSATRVEFMEQVRKAKRYIRRGEIYQANLSRRYRFALDRPAADVYAALKRTNPGCFFGLLDAGDFQIVSGSPERLVKCGQGALETRPIAGTRGRGRTLAEDRRLATELLLNEKERAEHVMLVDLERNDLGRVSEYGSVSVDELMGLEDYSHVRHIVSNVRGRLKEGLTAVDALKAFFPGGTITGTPKLRSMQVIDELEPVERGPYTGSLGYLSFSGDMDFNIIIRSLVLAGGMASLQVGAGIVADSDPRREYEETLHKAAGVFEALFGRAAVRC